MTENFAKKIRELRSSLNESQGEFGSRFGVEQATVSRWEKGGTIKRDIVPKILTLIINEKITISPSIIPDIKNIALTENASDTSIVITIPIFGAAAGGIWREEDDIIYEENNIAIPIDPRHPAAGQYARKVIGDSVSNRVNNGEFVICVKYDLYGKPLADGDLVDVQRLRSGLSEHTIKVYRNNGKRSYLCHDNKNGDDYELKLGHSDDGTEVIIFGVAIAAHRIF